MASEELLVDQTEEIKPKWMALYPDIFKKYPDNQTLTAANDLKTCYNSQCVFPIWLLDNKYWNKIEEKQENTNKKYHEFDKTFILYHKEITNISTNRFDKIISQTIEREPYNVGMNRVYNSVNMEKKFGYNKGAYRKHTRQNPMPNIAIYCNAIVTKEAITDNTLIVKKEDILKKTKKVHVLNMVGLAFDDERQPDFKYFFGEKNSIYDVTLQELQQQLDEIIRLYTKMWLFVPAAIQELLKKNIQIKNVVFSNIGGSAFAGPINRIALSEDEKKTFDNTENIIFGDQYNFYHRVQKKAIQPLKEWLKYNNITLLRDKSGHYVPNGLFATKISDFFQIFDDSKEIHNTNMNTFIDETLFLNAWDPWSLIGNEHNCIKSLDSMWGRNSNMSILGWPVTNRQIRYIAVSPNILQGGVSNVQPLSPSLTSLSPSSSSKAAQAAVSSNSSQAAVSSNSSQAAVSSNSSQAAVSSNSSQAAVSSNSSQAAVSSNSSQAAVSSNSSKKGVIILTTGSFNPVHKTHIRMLGYAVDELKTRKDFTDKYNINDITVYVSPSHKNYVKRKVGDYYIDANTRLELIRLSIEDYNKERINIGINPINIREENWESSQNLNPPSYIDFPYVVKHFIDEENIKHDDNKDYKSKEVLYLCGADLANKMIYCTQNTKCFVSYYYDLQKHKKTFKSVIINRKNTELNAFILNDIDKDKFEKGDNFVINPKKGVNYNDAASSTKVREAIDAINGSSTNTSNIKNLFDLMFPSALQYMVDKNIMGFGKLKDNASYKKLLSQPLSALSSSSTIAKAATSSSTIAKAATSSSTIANAANATKSKATNTANTAKYKAATASSTIANAATSSKAAAKPAVSSPLNSSSKAVTKPAISSPLNASSKEAATKPAVSSPLNSSKEAAKPAISSPLNSSAKAAAKPTSNIASTATSSLNSQSKMPLSISSDYCKKFINSLQSIPNKNQSKSIPQSAGKRHIHKLYKISKKHKSKHTHKHTHKSKYQSKRKYKLKKKHTYKK